MMVCSFDILSMNIKIHLDLDLDLRARDRTWTLTTVTSYQNSKSLRIFEMIIFCSLSFE